ncbi:unnamed protein product [Schistosoma bovis]|nr:unnamed protein product [Schistosoma bovis]
MWIVLIQEHSSTQIRSSLSCDSPQNKPNNKTWSSSLKCSVSCTSLLPVFSIPSEKSPSSYVYRTDGAERGLNGSLVDIQNIKRAFTSLDFRVIVHSNPTSESLFSLIRTISTQNLRDHDCFACVILSHGDEGGLIYATDGSIPVDRIIAPFRGDQCLDLRGKPKLFFIQFLNTNV